MSLSPARSNAAAANLPLLYLCRHGQTDWNAQGRIQGQTDIALNAHGRAQARRNGTCLREALGARAGNFRFLASPLSRTRETMRLIREELGLEPEAFDTDERLMELHFGDWQGRTLAEIEADEPGNVAIRDADKWNYRPPGANGESYQMLLERVRPVFEGLNGPSIVVAHGGVTRVFLHHCAGLAGQAAAHESIRQDRVLRWREGRADWV